MLRLDPAHPPLWRSATCLQFGVDDVARLEDPEPWEERVLGALEHGITEEDLADMVRERRIDPRRVEALFADLQPVLRCEAPPPRVRLQTPDEITAADAGIVADAMVRTGARVSVVPWSGRATPPADAGETVVLLAAHIVEPRRASALMREDVRHLPLVFDGAGAVVGPVVEPGVTACLACADAFAREADPAWPLVAAQLAARPVAPHPDLLVEAARVAVQLVIAAAGTPSRSVRLRSDSPHRPWRAHPPHEACGCRSLAGTATAPVPLAARRAPSSATAFGRPA